MILSDREIREALDSEQLFIDPAPPPESFSPCSLDLHVGYEFKRWKQFSAGAKVTFNLSEISIPQYGDLVEDVPQDGDGMLSLEPDGFILTRTLERIRLPLGSLIAARVEG